MVLHTILMVVIEEQLSYSVMQLQQIQMSLDQREHSLLEQEQLRLIYQMLRMHQFLILKVVQLLDYQHHTGLVQKLSLVTH